jgi:hypothetical protein
MLVLQATKEVGVALGVGDAVALFTGSVAGVGVTAGAAFLTATPLLQVNFFPFFTQVNFKPAEVLTWPFFLHMAPGLAAAVAEKALMPEIRQAIKRADKARFIL